MVDIETCSCFSSIWWFYIDDLSPVLLITDKTGLLKFQGRDISVKLGWLITEISCHPWSRSLHRRVRDRASRDNAISYRFMHAVRNWFWLCVINLLLKAKEVHTKESITLFIINNTILKRHLNLIVWYNSTLDFSHGLFIHRCIIYSDAKMTFRWFHILHIYRNKMYIKYWFIYHGIHLLYNISYTFPSERKR